MCCVCCMYVHVCMPACGDERATSGACPQLLPSFIFETEPIAQPDTHQFVWLSNELRASVSFLPTPPVSGLQMPSFVCRFWGTALRVSPLLGRLFTNWTIFPRPPPTFHFFETGFYYVAQASFNIWTHMIFLSSLPSTGTRGTHGNACVPLCLFPASPGLGLGACTAMLVRHHARAQPAHDWG